MYVFPVEIFKKLPVIISDVIVISSVQLVKCLPA